MSLYRRNHRLETCRVLLQAPNVIARHAPWLCFPMDGFVTERPQLPQPAMIVFCERAFFPNARSMSSMLTGRRVDFWCGAVRRTSSRSNAIQAIMNAPKMSVVSETVATSFTPNRFSNNVFASCAYISTLVELVAQPVIPFHFAQIDAGELARGVLLQRVGVYVFMALIGE